MAYVVLETVEATDDGDRPVFGVESASDLTTIDTDYPDCLPFSMAMNAQYMVDASVTGAYIAVKGADGEWVDNAT